MADVLAIAAAFAVALGLLGVAVALWLFIDGLKARRGARPGKSRVEPPP